MIFPYTLIRVSGENFSNSNYNNSHFLNLCNIRAQLLNSYNAEVRTFSEFLYNIISKETDINKKKLYIKIKRKIDNERFFIELDIDLVNSEVLIPYIISIKAILDRVNKVDDLIRSYYSEILLLSRKNLRERASSEFFLKGVIVASPNTYEEWVRQLDNEISHDTKKSERNIELTILNYYLRATRKTSPFSTFTTTALGTLTNSITNVCDVYNNDIQCNSNIQLNNYILKSFVDILSYNFLTNPQIRLNNGILLRNNVYSVFANDNLNNQEKFSDISANSFVNLIYEYLQFKGIVLLQELLNYLLEVVDSTYDKIADKVKDLIKAGFLFTSYTEFLLDHSWPVLLEDHLTKYSKDTHEYTLQFLSFFRENKNKLQTGCINDRIFIQNNLFDKLNLALFAEYSKINSNKSISHIGRNIEKQQLFYEDVTSKTLFDVNNKISETVLIQIHSLISKVNFRNLYQSDFNIIEEIFRNHCNRRVPLLKFYRIFIENIKLNPDKYKTGRKKTVSIDEWQMEFINLLYEKQVNSSSINIELEDLDIINNKLGVTPNELPSYSFGVFLQFFNEGDGIKAIINNMNPGYGKLTSRFLSYFDISISNLIKSYNINLHSNSDLFEVKDSSYFNANLHPSLTNIEINIPGGFYSNDADKKIDISKCFIEVDKSGILRLTLESGKVIMPLDLSFQNLEGRSDLYYFLNMFSNLPNLNFSLITNAVNGKFFSVVGNVKSYPRILINKNIVLQRKYWVVNVNDIPLSDDKVSDIEFFEFILKWRQSYNIPNEVYINLNPGRIKETASKLKAYDYKPQFIDFDDPLNILLFRKLIKRVKDNFILTEALPSSESSFGNRSVEFLYHWYK